MPPPFRKDHRRSVRGASNADRYTPTADIEPRTTTRAPASFPQADLTLSEPDPYLDPERPGTCPRCRVPLCTMVVEDIPLRGCDQCRGLFLSHVDEARAAEDERRAALIRFDRERAADAMRDRDPITYLRCPLCDGPMARQNYEKVSGIIVDRCPAHGLWLDPGELARVLQFAEGDGPKRREEFEQREREHLEDQRKRIRRIERATPGQLRGATWGVHVYWDVDVD